MENKDLLSRIWALMMAAEETEPKTTENFKELVECSSNDMTLRVSTSSVGRCEAVLEWQGPVAQETFVACMGEEDGLPEALAELWYKVCKEYRRWR